MTAALSALDAEVVGSVTQHRLLSTSQLHLLHCPGASRRWVRMVTAGLERRGLLGRLDGPPPGRPAGWYATAAGAAVAEELGVPARRWRMTPERAAGALHAHTAAVNDVGIALVEAARRAGDAFGWRDWHHEIRHPRPGATPVIADAVLRYTLTGRPEGDAVLVRAVEVDRATTAVTTLVDKLATYADLAASGTWRVTYAAWPKVLVVLDGAGDEALRRRAAAAVEMFGLRWPDTDIGLMVTTMHHLALRGADVLLGAVPPARL